MKFGNDRITFEDDPANRPEPETEAEENAANTDRSKPREINLGGDTVTMKTAEYPDNHRALVRWLFDHAKDCHWGWDELEQHVGISSNTFYRVWTGKYRYPKQDERGQPNPKAGELIPLDRLCAKLAHFKSLAEERAMAGRFFVETSVFRRINRIGREALVTQAIALVYGESQIGKTSALKEIARRDPNTRYVLMPASSGVQGMLRAIAASCHISSGLAVSVDEIRKRIFKYFDPTKLLLIDEVHECFVSYYASSLHRCLSTLRQLQEHTGCGMVLCGTGQLRHELENGRFAESLKQLRKRGIWELQLESEPTAKDLETIAAHYRLGSPTGDSVKLVSWIAKDMGLGKYTRFLARAVQLAGKKGEKFSWRHFEQIVGTATALKAGVSQ